MVVMTSFIPVIPVMCHRAVSCMPVQARFPAQIDHIDETSFYPSPVETDRNDFINNYI